jgi:hypothetical protein
VYTRASHWSLSLARSIQSIPPHPISLRRSLISFPSTSSLPSGLFPSGFHTKTPYAFLFSQACYMPCPSHPPLLYHSNYVWRTVKVVQLPIKQLSPASHYFILLRSIPLSTAVFKHPHSVRSSLKVRDKVSHPHKTKDEIIVCNSYT